MGQGNKSMWRFVVFTWCYYGLTNCLQICACKQYCMHVHVFFQVSQDTAKTYMLVSLNFTLEDTKIMEEELCAKGPVQAMSRARIERKGKK